MIARAGGQPSYSGAVIVGVPGLRLPLYPDSVGYPEKRAALPTAPLRRALRRFSPEVIHAVNPVMLAAGAVYYARRQRIPLIASYHAHLPIYAHYCRLGPFGRRCITALHNRAALLREGISRAELREQRWGRGTEAR